MVNGTYVLRRLIVVIPTLVLITAFTFFLQNGRGNKHDLAFNILGPGATEAGVARSSKEFHLDEPLYSRYMLWLSDALRGDLGARRSRARRCRRPSPRPCPVSLQLMLYAQILALVLAVPAGVYAAYRANRRGDRVTSTVGPGGAVGPELRARRRVDPVLRHRRDLDLRPAGRRRDPARARATCRSGRDPVEHFKHMALPTIALALGPGGRVHAGAPLGHDLDAARRTSSPPPRPRACPTGGSSGATPCGRRRSRCSPCSA